MTPTSVPRRLLHQAEALGALLSLGACTAYGPDSHAAGAGYGGHYHPYYGGAYHPEAEHHWAPAGNIDAPGPRN